MTQLRLLAGIDGIGTITLLSLCSSAVSADRVSELARELPRMQIARPIFQPIHMRRHPRTLPKLAFLRLFARVPYVVGKSANSAMRRLIARELATGAYDAVYLGSLGMAAYLPDVRRLAPGVRVVLEQHNVEWEIFDRLANNVRPILRPVLRWEARAVRRFERRVMRAVDSVIAISRTDANAFAALSGVEAVVVPPYIEPQPPRVERTTAPALMYIGALGWQPNVFGLDWLCREVWPIVRQLLPEATLTIVGGGLPRAEHGESLLPPLWRKPGVRAVGFVEDAEDAYRNALALVAPVVGGSGVRMKLLEAFRAGMPTVTTSDGAAGLEVADDRELLIADEPREFARRVVDLLTDSALRQRLRDAGTAYLRLRHGATIGREALARALGLPVRRETNIRVGAAP